MKLYKANLQTKGPGKLTINRSSGIFPFINTKLIETNILFFGYWFIKRNIKNINLIIKIRSLKGKLLYEKFEIINEVRSYNVSVKDILKAKKLTLISSGSVELEILSNENLYFPFPALVINYHSVNSSSVVHTCGRIYNDKYDKISNYMQLVPESGFDIIPNKKFLPFIGFVNGKKKLKNEHLRCRFINEFGESFTKNIHLKKLNPYETKIINLLNLKEKKFFQDKKGIVKINHNFKSFYPRFIAGNSNNTKSIFTLTHTFYDTDKEKNTKKHFIKNIDKKKNYDSILSLPLLLKSKSYTEIAIYPNFPKTKLNFGLEVFDSKGNLQNKIKSIAIIQKKLDYPVYLNLTDIIKSKNLRINKNKKYLAKIIISNNGLIPSRLKFGLNFGSPDKIDIPTNICFGATNVNPNILNKPKTFKWTPLLNKKRSYFIITNCSFVKNGYKSAKIKLNFWNESVSKPISKKVTISDNGIYWFDLQKDKKIKKFLSSKTGWVTVESDNPFINGFYFEDMKKGVLTGDHIF